VNNWRILKLGLMQKSFWLPPHFDVYPGVAKKNKKGGAERCHPLSLSVALLITDTTDLTEGLGESKVWAMQYSVFPGWHGSDLLATFFSTSFTADTASLFDDLAALMVPALAPFVAGISGALQSYFASYVTTGDPNTHRAVLNLPPSVHWDHPSAASEAMQRVVNVGDWGFGNIADTQNQKTPCDFWREWAAAVTALGGYSPPGAVVAQGLIAASGNVTRNYRGGNPAG
jgi:hypothetical protein